MIRRPIGIAFLVCVALVGLQATAEAQAPTISSISPSSGTTSGGTLVTITGTNLHTVTGITFGTTAATNFFPAPDGSQVGVQTPAHAAGAVNVVVTNPSGTATTSFTYIAPAGPAPTVSSVTPNKGPTAGGTPITISGTNFVSGATVTLGSTNATSVVFVNATTLTAVTPSAFAAGLVPVTVTNPDAQSATLAGGGFTYSSFCDSTITENCISSLQVNSAAPPAGVTADLFFANGAHQLQVVNTNNADRYELGPALTTASVITAVLKLSSAPSAVDPKIAVSTGLISSWTLDTAVTPHQITFVASPRASSWSRSAGCTPASCASTADVDYQVFLLAAFDQMTPPPSPPEGFIDFSNKFNKGFIATNAQYFTPVPNYNPTTKAIDFQVGAPHFKVGGTVLNTGFARMFVPDAVIVDLWGIAGGSDALAADPSLTSVTVGGSTASFAIEDRVDGALFKIGEVTPFGYSVPQIVVKPAASASSTVSVNRSSLAFVATKAGAAGALTSVTPAQTVAVTFTGGASAWTAVSNQPWLQITGGSGSTAGSFTAAIVNPGNVIGGSTSLTATITVTAPAASNSPRTITVTLSVDQTGGATTTVPFGAFDTPANGATNVVGAIPVTGWALDDVGVNRVEVWRNCLEAIDRPRGACASPAAGFLANYVFLGRAFLLAGARPDVETANPTYPFAYRAGWGFMLLTNALPHQILNTPEGGQGSYVLSAFAVDEEARTALLGTKTISVNNDAATVPFGAIDTPGQGATIPEASAPYNNVNAYPAFGWAMTQSGKCIDTTSTTAYKVFIDGVQRPLTAGANWVAGLNRSDLAAAYPGLCNSTNALAVYYINAAALGLTSGLHTISWDVTDSASQTVFGLGTRFFNIVASGSDPGLDAAPVAVGDATQLALASSHRDVQLAIGGRLSLDLGRSVDAGYQQVGTVLRALPPGSTLDGAAGMFAWEPPIGFYGPFDLVFTAGVDAIAVTVTIVDPTAVPAAVAMHVDAPLDGAIVTGSLTVGGWALDPRATAGSGIDAVHVWAVRRDVPGVGPQFAGAATLGVPRPDVAQALGAQFTTAGFQLTTSDLASGTYDLTVYARRQSSGQWEAARTVRVTIR